MQNWVAHAHISVKQLLSQLLVLAPVMAVLISPHAGAGPQVLDRYDLLSTSEPGAVATHRLGFRYTNFTSQVGSVSFEFCSNSPIPQITCVPPAGFNALTTNLSSQGGQTGFSYSAPNSTSNLIVITRAPQTPIPATAESSYVFQNITNPSNVGSYFVRIQTYSSINASGAAIEEGGIAFAITDPFNVNAEVPPYLLFCTAITITNYDCSSATSFFIDLGEFSKSSAIAASSGMVAASNAGSGFSISVAGTTLTSGNNVIQPLAAQSASNPGTSQFGMNLRANSSPGIGANPAGPGTASPTADYALPNRFKFLQGDAVASTSTTSDVRKFTVSYITNINAAQPAGIYATTVSFIALANF